MEALLRQAFDFRIAAAAMAGAGPDGYTSDGMPNVSVDRVSFGVKG